MTWELSKPARISLGYLLWMYSRDSDQKVSEWAWGGAKNDLAGLDELIQRQLVAVNPTNDARVYATVAGGKFMGETVVNPFEPTDEHKLTAALGEANAEIARLTAALEASEAARKVADAGWSECIKLSEAQSTNLKIDENLISDYREEIETLKQELRIYRDEISF